MKCLLLRHIRSSHLIGLDLLMCNFKKANKAEEKTRVSVSFKYFLFLIVWSLQSFQDCLLNSDSHSPLMWSKFAGKKVSQSLRKCHDILHSAAKAQTCKITLMWWRLCYSYPGTEMAEENANAFAKWKSKKLLIYNYRSLF